MKQPTLEGAGSVRRSSVIAGLARWRFWSAALSRSILAHGDLLPIISFGLSAEEIEDTIRSRGQGIGAENSSQK